MVCDAMRAFGSVTRTSATAAPNSALTAVASQVLAALNKAVLVAGLVAVLPMALPYLRRLDIQRKTRLVSGLVPVCAS